jgi:hypothetical protein
MFHGIMLLCLGIRINFGNSKNNYVYEIQSLDPRHCQRANLSGDFLFCSIRRSSTTSLLHIAIGVVAAAGPPTIVAMATAEDCLASCSVVILMVMATAAAND